MASFTTAFRLALSTLVTMLGTVSPAIKPKTPKLTSNSDKVKPSLKACCLLLVACCLLLVACCLLLVACF
ncbi:MAG: hypothetical protein NTW61_02135 [Candidatus Melainabacteria bacterium]|nr:hypothetical protein [Candidatus Melainabacteria bacterium]